MLFEVRSLQPSRFLRLAEDIKILGESDGVYLREYRLDDMEGGFLIGRTCEDLNENRVKPLSFTR